MTETDCHKMLQKWRQLRRTLWECLWHEAVFYIFTLLVLYFRDLYNSIFIFGPIKGKSEMERTVKKGGKKPEKTVSEWALFLFIPLSAEANRPDCCEACL